MSYPDTLELRAARADYFRRSGLGEDGGYSARWVRFRIGPIRLPFPNTRARVRALPLHDLHHLATGYDTSWTGEAEIAAWELAGGCGRYWAAWLLNLMAFPIGLVIAPGRTWRAFRRGRSARTLYQGAWEPGWLDRTVGVLRERLAGGGPDRSSGLRDGLLFAACGVPAVGGLLLLVIGARALLGIP